MKPVFETSRAYHAWRLSRLHQGLVALGRRIRAARRGSAVLGDTPRGRPLIQPGGSQILAKARGTTAALASRARDRATGAGDRSVSLGMGPALLGFGLGVLVIVLAGALPVLASVIGLGAILLGLLLWLLRGREAVVSGSWLLSAGSGPGDRDPDSKGSA